MAIISIPTSFNIDLHFNTAGFGRRLLALIIDLLVQIFYLYLVFKFMSPIFNRMHSGHFSSMDISMLLMIVILPVSIYHIVCEVALNGQSIGKKIMGIRVVSLTGSRPGIGQFLIRWLLRISDTWIFILLYTILTISANGNLEKWMIFVFGSLFLTTDTILITTSGKSQRIGDILAGTIIITTANKADITTTMFKETDAGYTPVFPQVMRLSDKDLNVLNQLLRGKKGRYQRQEADLAAIKIKNYLGIDTRMDAYAFFETLLKDYNYISTT